jgi:hypothetical protein
MCWAEVSDVGSEEWCLGDLGALALFISLY